jgi:hypothetical protein
MLTETMAEIRAGKMDPKLGTTLGLSENVAAKSH